ncbi:glutamate racemase [Marinococcus sp. PL1-022]|jgi:glutamate racemase|uniref:glutamate racemase n=1 Tax=Marinococcus sp. PL1-022 TaxID=3095363 RepID=UPI0026382DC8|nr:glutamate racemase [Marinococcus sp. PL1-022]MDX6152058.1 glutamate racemase [Marinococcus sp. PL1-022]
MKQPIGVIDSGLGGLTVAREILRQLPKEEMIYIGDTARCPYGPRPIEEVREFTWQMIARLQSENIKMLVIACNTATAVVLEEVKQILDIPVVGVITPGAISALKVTKTDQVAVIGTSGTVKSGAYERALKSINEDVEVTSLACVPFVPLVEQGQCGGRAVLDIVKQTLRPLKYASYDTLILGCTHYPLLEGVIQEAVGPDIQLISSGDETAREVSTLLNYHETLNTGEIPPFHRFYTTGPEKEFRSIANQWMDQQIEHVVSIRLDSDDRFAGSEKKGRLHESIGRKGME